MAEVLPKSTVDPGSVGVKESLMHTLDDLLERYLNLVHQYYAQQQTLAKDLSSVRQNVLFICFDHAVRYFRLNQGRGVALTERNSKIDAIPEHSFNSVASQDSKKKTDTISVSIDQPTLRSTDMRNAKIRNPDTEKEMEAPVKDPLRWFGILVPSTLRASQSSFKREPTSLDAPPSAISTLRGAYI
ncbi:MAG: hypothetical protein LQ352_001009 [Teloschistes flavicans]|nr:MAG: hypothetical protein LQ352_001009 [Teloschistes flavicans]